MKGDKFMLRRKFVWLMILMVWVGMVTSVVIYQGDDYLSLEPVTGGEIELVQQLDSDEYLQEIEFSNDENIMPPDTASENGDFFIDHRLERNKVRSEQINYYREIINNPNHSEAAKTMAEEKMLNLTERMEKELEIEGLIRGRGYDDALAFIHDEAVDVIIRSEGLEQDEVALIGDIIVKTTGFSSGDLTIIERK